MPILSGDIKLVASQVMDDVPEGGGAPTSNLIADGVSNAIFPDISELDRAGGRVNLRKLHVSVQTADRDTYLGSNIIVADPPADPNVSITMFSTGDTFDTRALAASRVESYLNKGPLWPGMLYENHIAGQRSVQLFQRSGVELPPIGRTLVLVQNEGLSTQIEQYVRATEVVAVLRTFTDAAGDYTANVVTVSISDALRSDMIGSPAIRTFTAIPTAAKVRDTVVADAGVYVGVTPITQAVNLGDFTVNATSVYSQLVPSAQTEVPLSDIRTNGLSAALVATGGPLVQTISMGFTTTTSMQVGGPILPGSLTIVRSGITATDKGGLLINASVEVGQVDYDNGIVTLSTNLWGASVGTHTVTFTPAAIPDLISEQRLIRVTAESRSLNYTFVTPPAVPRSMTVSYLAQGRWYVLRDAGAGILQGISSAHGIGTVNYTTGSVLVTLGALPDVGSAIVIQLYTPPILSASNNTTLLNDAKVYVPLNTSGLVSEEPGAKTIGIGSLGVSWTNGGAKLAIDDGAGNLTGDATGTVNYTTGVVKLSPNALPPAGTVFLLDTNGSVGATATVTVASPTLGVGSVHPGSVGFDLTMAITYTVADPAGKTSHIYGRAYGPFTQPVQFKVKDNGAGVLVATSGTDTINIGTVNYTTGAMTITSAPSIDLNPTVSPVAVEVQSTVSWGYWTSLSTYGWSEYSLSAKTRTAVVTSVTVQASYSTSVPSADSVSIPVTQYVARTLMVPNYTLKGVGFTLGTTNYSQLTDGTLRKDVDPTTGVGIPAGSVSAALGAVVISSWVTGVAPTLINWRGLVAPPSVGVAAPFTAFASAFRTASSPLRPASLSVLGTMQDGTTFNVTADINGKINGTRVKGRVDYQYGLVELYFVNPNGDVALNTDLSHLQIAGLTTIPGDLAMLSDLRYSAVAYSYLPLDASLLGIDPVRLPSDGKVPIFRAGGFAVVGHTGTIIATVSNAQVIDCARVRLSRVRVVGANGAVINTGYTVDLETGLVTFTDVTGYSQPVTIEHRIEDMGVIREAQISGEVTFTRPVTHAYPLGSHLSSALVAGDLKSRVSIFFDQATWANTWADAVSGSVATGTYNNVSYPVEVTNAGAVTERWSLVFTGATTYNLMGEHVGVLGTFNTTNAATFIAPINPATGAPYFKLHDIGWGGGWSAGNALRFNTVGAMAPVWVVRTVQQGPNTGLQHSFTILSRGDVDRP